MEKNKKQEKTYTRKRLNSIILLVAFAAIMLIVSTYAWFSTQKSVAITNLAGTVQIAEGMEISLDGVHFKQTLDLSQVNWTDTSNTSEYPVYEGNTNNIPEELQPVSTVGSVGTADLTFYRGEYTSNEYTLNKVVACTPAVNNPLTKVGGIGTVTPAGEGGGDPTFTPLSTAAETYPGYYAFDVFIKNTIQGEANKAGVTDYGTGTGDEHVAEWGTDLQLNSDSFAKILEKATGASNKIDTIDWNETSFNATEAANMANTLGTQNTVRVALAVYGDTANVNNDDVIAKTVTGTHNIRQVAIWEPNSSRHVKDIVDELSAHVLWDATPTGDPATAPAYNSWGPYTQIVTHAVTKATPSTITYIYNWDGRTGADAASLALQRTVKTTPLLLKDNSESKPEIVSNNDPTITDTYTNYNEIHEGVTDLTDISTTPVKFHIACNQVSRVRVYLWLEGQDVDCRNVASMGHGVQVNLDLITGEAVGSRAEDSVVTGTYTYTPETQEPTQEP